MSKISDAPNDIQDELNWIQVKEESENSFFGKLQIKTLSNPLVPIGALITTGVLATGVYNLIRQDKVKQQKMMRRRVLAQGLTLIAAMGGIFLSEIYK